MGLNSAFRKELDLYANVVKVRRDRRNALYRRKRGHQRQRQLIRTKTLTTTRKNDIKDNDKEGNYVKDNPQKVRSLPGVRSRHQNIDTVIIR